MTEYDFERFHEEAKKLRVLGVKITQHGKVLDEAYWDDNCRRNVYSASKSFTSAAVGIAVREGLLRLDEKLTEAFPDELPDEVPENLARAEVRDLLTMCLGQASGNLMGAQRPLIPEENWVRLSLSLPFAYKPGTHFVYNNVGPYLAGILVQRRAGCDLVSYLMPRLFEPLGIRRPIWEEDPMRNTFGAGGLFLSLSELDRLGLLYLQNGNWNGRQLIPEEWVRESLSVQAENGRYGYGYLFWAGPHGSFRADGKYSQLSIIMRDKDAVVTTMAECRDAAALEKLIFDEIWTQL